MTKGTSLSARAALATLHVEPCAPDAEALMQEVMRPPGQEQPDYALAAEYPLIFGADAPGCLVVLRDESNTPRSACALLTREWHLAGDHFRAGLIGSVATDPDWRGQGLASRVLAHAEETLRGKGCLFAMLWAEDPPFYERRGYATFGAELNFLLEPDPNRAPIPPGVRPYAPADLGAVAALHRRHPVRVERSEIEMGRLLTVPDMSILVLERGGAVVAYACMGKGADLVGVVHEWAGECEDVLTLLHAHGATRTDPTVLLCPLSAPDHARHFQAAGMRHQVGVLGMGVLLDDRAGPSLQELFPPRSPGPEGITPFAWGLDSV